MRRFTHAWACATVLALALAHAHVMHAQRVRAQVDDTSRGSPEVRRVDVRGAKHVNVDDLKRSIATQASGCRSILLAPFCFFSNSPTFEDKYYLDEDELRRDVVRIRVYYWQRGYRETMVDTTVTPAGPNRVNVTFIVNEGPPTLIRSLRMSYDTTLIPKKVRDRITLLHVREPLDMIRLDSMRVLFQNELWNQGYGDAVVDTTVRVDSARHLADVSLTFTPHRRTTVGRITISGNEEVSTRAIRNSITFGPGDLFRLSDVLESQRNLYESSLFRLATITVPPQRDSVKNVEIDVTEAPLHEARAGPGFNNVDFLQFVAHYTDYNFMGGARRLDVDLSVGNLFARQLSGRGPFRDVAADAADTAATSPFFKPTYSASVELKKPSFLRPGDAVAGSAFSHRSMNPGVFVDYGYGGQVTYTHLLAPRAPLSVSYRYELNRVHASDTYFCVNYGVCDTLTIGALRTHQSLSPLLLTGYVDRSDLPFSPTKGYIARLDYEYASKLTASDFRYQRIFFDGAAYDHKSGSRTVYSAHLRLGGVQALHGGTDGDVLHPRKRFYAGGANSVRGFAENQLGPRILTVDDSTLLGAAASSGGICALTTDNIQYCDPNAAKLSDRDFSVQPLGGTSLVEGSVEYRFPITPLESSHRFMFATFVDAGFVGAGHIRGFDTIREFIHSQWAVTPGVGLRYLSGFGPIRFDVGFNPMRTETLGVVTTVRDRDGKLVIAPLSIPRRFSANRSWLSRLAVHFSIGEAY